MMMMIMMMMMVIIIIIIIISDLRKTTFEKSYCVAVMHMEIS
jgi:hypothetical protein